MLYFLLMTAMVSCEWCSTNASGEQKETGSTTKEMIVGQLERAQCHGRWAVFFVMFATPTPVLGNVHGNGVYMS